MKNFNDLYSRLRRKNIRHYFLLAGCCFFSVTLITAFISIINSPTVLNTLPEGGDSRKQVMMIFVMTIVGCGMFTVYAAGLFLRGKAREIGLYLALGAARRQLKKLMTRELAWLSIISCGLGLLAGPVLAWLLWWLFRLLLIDTDELTLFMTPQIYIFAGAFSTFVIGCILFLLSRFMRNINIIEILNEEHISEPIRAVPRWFGGLGIALIIIGGLLGYFMPTFFNNVLKWYAPEALCAIFYLPALAGLYMFLLNTVVNGWRWGKNRYRNIVATSVMKFQGRQTVRTMLVIALMTAGAYFAAFYVPMLGTGFMYNYETRLADYAFHYRSDQILPDQAEIKQLAADKGVEITDYISQPTAVLGVDGQKYIEMQSSLGTTYTYEYRELLESGVFLSETAYNTLTGDSLDITPGYVTTVLSDNGAASYIYSSDITLITNPITSETLIVSPLEDTLCNSLLTGCHILDDNDYARISQGLTDTWLETRVIFNVADGTDSYDFAKELFEKIVAASGREVEVDAYWDAIEEEQAELNGETYFLNRDYLISTGEEVIDYNHADSFSFRNSWKYMPQFRILDKEDFTKVLAIFLLLFIFVAVICFAAVILITYTRSMTLITSNRQIYEDLQRLGAARPYLQKTIKKQLAKVYFSPILTGTLIILFLYTLILFANDGRFTVAELLGGGSCLLVTALISALLYCCYRFTLKQAFRIAGICQENPK